MAKPSAKTPDEKLRIVLAVLEGELSAAEAGRRHGVSEQTISNWRRAFLDAGRAGLVSGEDRRHSGRARLTMRAWRVEEHGSPGAVLAVREIPVPEPAPGFLRIRVDAAGLGLPDVLMCAASYPLTPGLPFTPGQEVVGIVTAVGADVDPALVGTRQMGVTAFYLGSGGFAEEALAPAATVFPAPDSLDDQTAAGFHIPFHTAWTALRDRARLLAGEDLVVLGAAGGSGSAAIALGAALGARVIAVAGGTEKAEYCRQLGAESVVDHSNTDVAAAVRELTGGRGANVVFDPVGADAGERAAGAMANEGRFLLVGFAGGRWPAIDPARMVAANFSVLGVYVGAYDREHTLAAYRELFDLVETGRLAPIPTRVIDFADLVEGLTHLADRSALGKVVMKGYPRATS